MITRRSLLLAAPALILPRRLLAQVPMTGAGIGTPIPPPSGSTFDPANTGSTIVLSNGNLTATGSSSGYATSYINTSKTTGKLYVEFKVVTVQSGLDNLLFGFAGTPTLDKNDYIFSSGQGAGIRGSSSGAGPFHTGFFTTVGVSPSYNVSNGDILSFAMDLDAGKIWVAYNNTYGGNPAAGTGELFDAIIPGTGSPYYVCVSFTSANWAVTLQPTSVSQTYSPPSGFSAWG